MMSFPADMNSYGAGGALTKSKYASPGVGGTIVYFSVEDTAEPESRVADAGGTVIRPKFSIGEFGWITLCQDTEGNMFGLNSMKYNFLFRIELRPHGQSKRLPMLRLVLKLDDTYWPEADGDF